ncbi:MAG: PorV/PorQ family protein [Candidatus Zixiibacteriota bacterium]
MTTRILKTCLTMTLLLAFAAVDGFADVSVSGVQFLKLAPGARAVGMGESFVGVADDATATYYNAAGLGTQPLGSSWQTVNIPDELRPLRQVVAVRVRGGGTISSYDLWAITPKGLARFDQSKWYFEEVFRTRTDQTVSQMAKANVGGADETRLSEVIRKIAEANSPQTYALMNDLCAKITSSVPSDYKDSAAIREGVDSLRLLYDQCRLNWENVAVVSEAVTQGMKDSSLNKSESDKILFALERVRNRFIPEEIRIPLSIWFEGEPKMLASRGDGIVFLTTEGLYSLVGSEWKSISFGDSVAAPSVTSLATMAGTVFVGTTNGVWRVDGAKASPLKSVQTLPEGPVTALGGNGANDIFAVVGQQLWHYNGADWSMNRDYTIVLDDTIDKIIDKLALYGSGKEREELRTAIFEANKAAAPAQVAGDSVSQTMAVSETPEALFTRIIQAGKVIKVPYSPALKGTMTAIRSQGTDKLFLGGTYGVAFMNAGRWALPGFAEVQVVEGQTKETIVGAIVRPQSISPEAMTAMFVDMNDLGDQQFSVGARVKVYRNPAACATLEIVRFEGKHYFATSEGVIEYDGASWGRSEFAGIGNERIFAIISDDEGFQVVSGKTIAHFVPARREITAMHTPLLSNLDVKDLNFEFVSMVMPISGLGTFGVSLSLLSYGDIVITDEFANTTGSFSAYDISLNLLYGGALTRKLAGGLGARVIYSRLSKVGAGAEVGDGTATGVALSGGLLYQMKRNLRLGLSARNFGPDISYIDASQSDPLPRTLAVGFGWWPKKEEDWRVLITGQAEKEMVAVNSGFQNELQQVIVGGGAEVVYLGMIAGRIGYRYDGEEYTNSYMTFGAGLYLMDEKLRADFSFIPSSKNQAQDNTPKFSLTYAWF